MGIFMHVLFTLNIGKDRLEQIVFVLFDLILYVPSTIFQL